MAEDKCDLFALDGDVPVHFEEGLFGFEGVLAYSLQREEKDDAVMLLQAEDTRVPSFVLVDPYAVFPEYKPLLPADVFTKLGAGSTEELCFFAIAVVKEDCMETVVNLKSPVVINRATGSACQVIMDCDYPIRYRVFSQKQ